MRSLSALLLLLFVTDAEAGAISKARQAALERPMDAETWIALGDAYRAAGRRKMASASYERALQIDPNNTELQVRATAASGPSLARLERRALRNPGDDEMWGDLADKLVAYGETERALEYYLYAMRIDPGDSEWSGKIAQLGGAGRMQEILAASAETGTDDESVGDYADLSWDGGDAEGACALYQRAHELDGGDSEWREKLATRCGVYVDGYGGEYGEGVSVGGEYGSEAVLGSLLGYAGGSGDASLLVASGRAKLLAGDRQGALEDYEGALLIDPSDADALHAVLVLSGISKLDLLSKLAERITDNDELYGDMGDHFVALGRLAEARESYERALALDPSDDEWNRKLLVLDPSRTVAPGVGGGLGLRATP